MVFQNVLKFNVAMKSGVAVYDEVTRTWVSAEQEKQNALQASAEEYTKHYPPDSTAGKWWLNNRQKELWRDKHEVDVTVNGDKGSRLLAAKKRVKDASGDD